MINQIGRNRPCLGGAGKPSQSKGGSLFFEEIEVTRLGFLAFSHKHWEVSHDSIHVPWSSIFRFDFFKPKMSRVVLF